MVIFQQVRLQSDLWLMAEQGVCIALTLWHICSHCHCRQIIGKAICSKCRLNLCIVTLGRVRQVLTWEND